MNPKKIPNTNERHYISGWEALNIPDENGNTADWHPTTYLYSNSVNDTIKLYNTNDILKNRGSSKQGYFLCCFKPRQLICLGSVKFQAVRHQKLRCCLVQSHHLNQFAHNPVWLE